MIVKIKNELTVNGAGNLTVGSTHEVVACPKEYENRYKHCIWVMGETEPIRLHQREFEIIDSKDPTHPAYAIDVIEIDMDAMGKALSEQLQENPQFAGTNYEMRTSLAIIKGVSIATDDEACYFVDIHKGMDLDFYKERTQNFDEEGNSTGYSIAMFPSGGVTLTLPDILKFKKRDTNLAEFMGSRFGYNPRIITNTLHLMKHIEEQKELDSRRVKFESKK